MEVRCNNINNFSQPLGNTELSFRTQGFRFLGLSSLIFFSLFLPASFHQVLSSLPCCFCLLRVFTTRLLTVFSISQLPCQLSGPYSNFPRGRAGQIAWSLSRTKPVIGLSPPENTDKQLPLSLLFLPSPGSRGRLLVPEVQSMTCDKKHFDPIFQKGAAMIDSNRSVTDAPPGWTPNNSSHCGIVELLIVEQPLNYSNFSTPRFLFTYYMSYPYT